MSHASVRDYVDTKFDGDWDVYMEKLASIKEGLEKIQKRGRGVVIELKDCRVKLSGKKLDNYIRLSGERLNTVRCLADKVETADLQNFATAAGGDAKENSSNVSSPVGKREGYRTFITLPRALVVELRKQVARRSLIENRVVSINDIITRSIRQKYAK